MLGHADAKDKGATQPSQKASSPMKSEDMHAMMHECMEMHKDGMMCESEMMSQCEGNMSKEECKKMMNETKKRNNKSKTKN